MSTSEVLSSSPLSRRRLLAGAAGAAVTAAVPAGAARASVPPSPEPPLPYTGTPPAGERLCFLSAAAQLDLLRRGAVSAVELTTAHLARIGRVNPLINALVYLVPPEQVLAAAAAADRRYRARTARPLEGLLLVVKDLFDWVQGMPNSFGSKPFRDAGFVPPYTSLHIQRLLDAGAIIVGKSNTAEFGHKGITDNLAWGPTSTPFDLAFNAGGSSGGSAAAVAAFLAPLSQGSDAGGSVRIPAAMCGVVGFKPTQGRIPPGSPLPHTPMLTPGPIARTVTDTAMLMQVMGGPDRTDMFGLLDDPDYLVGLRRSVRGKRIAYVPGLDLWPIEQHVAAAVRGALELLTAAGATVSTVSMGLGAVAVHELRSAQGRPVTQADLAALWVMEQSVLYAHGRDLLLVEGVPLDLLGDGVREQLSPDLVTMLRRGEATSATGYRHGELLRSAVNTAIEQVLARYDAIVCPTLSVAGVANRADGMTVGPSTVDGVTVDPLIGWTLTYPFNFTGHPAISIPAGMTGRLPVGMQLVGRRGADTDLLSLAAAVEHQASIRHHAWTSVLPRH